MQILLWVVEGVSVGWIAGKMMAGIGRDLVMDTVMGMAGALAGGFIVNTFNFVNHGKMIYASLAAIIGAIIFTVATRFISGRRESGATN
jgi:uncharacterized membrane protein YeaQ/YmgE (transglycosylase-associated protein family)